jgi:hypothetical protein
MRIPLHSLIILVGSDHAERHAWACKHFYAHEIISQEHIRLELTGHVRSPINRYLVKDELVRRVELRLSLGQQVVLILDQGQHVYTPEWNQVCEALHAHLCVVTFDQKPMPGPGVIVTHDQVQFDVPAIHKVLAVGDVHGDYAAMKQAYDYAQQHDIHVVWLGDVLDYGDHNLKCVHLAYESVRHKQAHMIWGNHEKKIGRWMDADWGTHFRGRLSEASYKTIREIDKLNVHRKRRFQSAWKFLEHASFQMWRVADWTFTHGAVHADAGHACHHRITGTAGEWAYYGEVHSGMLTEDGYPRRVWNWVDDLPAHARVVVGHDWLDRLHCDIVHKVGTQGGQVWCVDTGNSKGGRLSALEIDLNTNKWEAKVFTP